MFDRLQSLYRTMFRSLRASAHRRTRRTSRQSSTESLETRSLLAATITDTSFLSTGTAAANTTTVTVTFSEAVSFALGSQQNPAMSASQIKAVNPSAADGIYWIDVTGGSPSDAFQVYCDMTTAGGGWMLGVNSVIGSEPSSNDIVSNTGTVGLTTGHTRNLDSFFAGAATAEIRHDIDATNVGLGRFNAKYTVDTYKTTFNSGMLTTLAGHDTTNLLFGSFNTAFQANSGGADWFYAGFGGTCVPTAPNIGGVGPNTTNTELTLNSYRIWIRGTGTAGAATSYGGAELTTNYQLQRAGSDGLLLNSDTAINPTSVSISGNTATLTFPALAEDTWRLTVKDTITNASGVALDGDGNGTAGGNWLRDFVVGADTSSFATPGGFTFDPEYGGAGAGQFVQGTAGVFDGVGRLSVGGTDYSPALASPVLANSNQTLMVPATTISGLSVSRQVTVPSTGSYSFARTINTLTNSTGSPVTVPVRTFGNLGTDATTSVFLTSDGDTIVEATDTWFGTDDGDGSGAPAVIHFIRNSTGLSPTAVAVTEDNVDWSFDVTIGAGETKRVASFAILATNRADAVSAANALVTGNGFAGEAGAFLTNSELSSIVNFQFNQAPTDIGLTNSTLAENAGANAVVGTLSGTDPDVGDTLIFSLPSGVGNNSLFNISGTSLRANSSFNFEAGSSYSVTIRVTDAGGLSYDEAFAITITDVNEAPTDISLTNASLAENAGANAVVGTLSGTDPDLSDSLTFTLPAGLGNNSLFNISGTSLRANSSFNFEAGSSYSVTVRVTDAGGLSYDEAFAITITDVNEAPTDISLTNSSLAENAGTNAVVGTLSGTDPDLSDSLAFTLPTGLGNNGLFNISGTSLRANSSFNFEAGSSYSVTVRATDAGNLTFDKVFTISITNVNEAPTDISLSGNSVAENQAIGTPVGSFSTTDPDSGNTFTYTLVTGTGSTDNASFQIVGGVLKTNAVFNYEVKNSYSIRVQSVDQGGLAVEKIFTVSVTNTSEVNGIDVQLGQTQRSYVRYLDVVFDQPDDIMNLINNGRFQLTKNDLNGLNPVNVPLTAGMFTKVGNSARIDFGTNGLGGNRNTTAGDGYYQIGIDLDGNGAFEATQSFFRLLGDVNGDRKVDTVDSNLVLAAFGSTNVERDVNGDGTVNANDRTLVLRSVGRKLKDDLFTND